MDYLLSREKLANHSSNQWLCEVGLFVLMDLQNKLALRGKDKIHLWR